MAKDTLFKFRTHAPTPRVSPDMTPEKVLEVGHGKGQVTP